MKGKQIKKGPSDTERKQQILSKIDKLPELEAQNSQELLEKALEIANVYNLISSMQIQNGEDQLDVNQRLQNADKEIEQLQELLDRAKQLVQEQSILNDRQKQIEDQ